MDQSEELVAILVVDDQVGNLLVMENLLAELALPLLVVTAEGGNRALRLSLQQPYALILLDVQMPGMNGYEVAELLRTHPRTSTTPIIFVTAGMTDSPHVIKGYESGAVDYLAKPLDRRQLGSKVRVFTELFQQRRLLERNQAHLEAEVLRRSLQLQLLNAELEQRVEERSQQLKLALQQVVEAERHAALGRMVAGVAHEMNTPIGNILLVSSTLGSELDHLARALTAERVSRQELLSIGEQCRAGAQLIESSAHRAAALVSRFKQLGEKPECEFAEHFDLLATVESVLQSLSAQLYSAGVSLELNIEPGLVSYGFPIALEKIILLLVSNSLVHAFVGPNGAPAKPCIKLRAAVQTGQLMLSYGDNGCGVPHENLARLFDPFFSTKMGQGGSGLGLSTVRKLTHEPMNGEVKVSSPVGEGLQVDFIWPLNFTSEQHA